MGAITLAGVTKHFDGATAIASVDLNIGDGEFVVFVGPSGCGKSTLPRLIDGMAATATPPAKRGLAMGRARRARQRRSPDLHRDAAHPLRHAGHGNVSSMAGHDADDARRPAG